MTSFGTWESGRNGRRSIPAADGIYYKSIWMNAESVQGQPTAFLLEQPPGAVLEAHFHRNNQYQVFVEGSGSIGAHAVEALTVHYAGAYTGYGPLRAGDEGLMYFTFRLQPEEGYIPVQMRKEMRPGPKQVASSSRWQPDLRRVKNQGGAIVEPLIESRAGALSYGWLLPASTEEALTIAPEACGVFVMVAQGSLLVADQRLGKWESCFLPASRKEHRVLAGESGACVVVLHMPEPDVAYR